MSSSLFSSLSPARKHFLKVMVSISITIRNARKDMKMSQKEFAQFMNVTQAMVSKWESGHYNFSMEALVRIYDKLNLPLNFEIPSKESSAPSSILEYIATHKPPTNITLLPAEGSAA